MSHFPIRFRRLAWRCVPLPLVQLTLLGFLVWLSYLHLTLRYPLRELLARYLLTDFGRINNWSLASLQDFIFTIFIVFALYLLTVHLIARHPNTHRSHRLVIGLGLLFAVTLSFMYPIMATDIFEYVFHSRILVHYGQNPLVVAPITFKGDPFLTTVNWSVQPSPYGPLWLLLTVPGSFLAGNDLILNLFMMRGLAILFYVGSALVISAILKHLDGEKRTVGVLLFAWNPLILLEAAGNGHNELIMMFFILLAVYFLVQKKWVWVVPLLIASVLIKYVSVLLLPPFLIYCLHNQKGWHARLVFLFKTCAVSALLITVVTFRFLALPSGLLAEANFYSLLAVPTLIFNLLKGAQGEKLAKTTTFVATLFCYLPIYFLSLRGLALKWRPPHLLIICSWLFIAYLGFACMQFQPWFVVVPITLGIWVNHALMRRLLLVFTASALFSYVANFFWVWNIHIWSPLQVNAMFVGVIFVPLVIVGLLNSVSSMCRHFQTRVSALDLKLLPAGPSAVAETDIALEAFSD